jgi:hypothetical protein
MDKSKNLVIPSNNLLYGHENNPIFMQPEGSLLCSQEPTAGSHYEWDESSYCF